MIKDILMPIISLGGMSILFGAGLAFASQKFAVDSCHIVTENRLAIAQ